jgi:hypothetical protein
MGMGLPSLQQIYYDGSILFHFYMFWSFDHLQAGMHNTQSKAVPATGREGLEGLQSHGQSTCNGSEIK